MTGWHAGPYYKGEVIGFRLFRYIISGEGIGFRLFRYIISGEVIGFRLFGIL